MNENSGTIVESYATGKIKDINDAFSTIRAGGAVSLNQGEIANCYADVDMKFLSSTNEGTGSVGGFVGQNSGIIKFCYSVSNINSAISGYVGGFVGCNDANGIINNSFTTGAIDNTNSNASTGYFVGSPNASGIMLKCYYDRDMVYMLNGETATPANSLGEAEQLFILKSNDFLKETLLWKEEFWAIDGLELPTLVYNLI